MFGTQDILLLGVIVVVLFGATKLPQLGSGVGQAIRNFKNAVNEPDTVDVTPQKGGTQKEGTSEKQDQ